MANLNNGAIVCKKVTSKFYLSDTDLSGSSPGLRGRQYRLNSPAPRLWSDWEKVTCKKLLMRIHCKLLLISPPPITIYSGSTSCMVSCWKLGNGYLWGPAQRSPPPGSLPWMHRDVSMRLCFLLPWHLGYLLNREPVTLEYNCHLLLSSPHWEMSLFRVGMLSYSSCIPSPWHRDWHIVGGP